MLRKEKCLSHFLDSAQWSDCGIPMMQRSMHSAFQTSETICITATNQPMIIMDLTSGLAQARRKSLTANGTGLNPMGYLTHACPGKHYAVRWNI